MDKEQIQVKPQPNKQLPTSANGFDLSDYILKTKICKKNSSNIFSQCHTEPFFNLVVIALGTVTVLLNQHSKTILGLCCNMDEASPALLPPGRPWGAVCGFALDPRPKVFQRHSANRPGHSSSCQYIPKVLQAEKSSPTVHAGRYKEVT